MKLPANAHVAVVDGQNFLLMRNAGTTTEPVLQSEGRPDVDETNKDAGKREHESAHTRGGEPHDRAAHAAGVADWLNHEVLTHNIDQLLVIADPDTLGEMRRHYHKQLKQALVGEVAKTMTGRRPAEIVRALHD